MTRIQTLLATCLTAIVSVASLSVTAAHGGYTDPDPQRGPKAPTTMSKDPIRVDLSDSSAFGRTLRDWGYDLKYDRAVKQILADKAFRDRVFGSGAVTTLRIPIFADASSVNAKGKPRAALFAPTAALIRATTLVLSEHPDLQVFASLKTVCPGSKPKCNEFADSLKNKRGKLRGKRYGAFLAAYLKRLDAAGIPVAVVGPDNEGNGGRNVTDNVFANSNNEGAITPRKFSTIATTLRARYDGVVRLTFNDAKKPDTKTLCTKRLWKGQVRPDIAALHYDSDKRSDKMGGPNTKAYPWQPVWKYFRDYTRCAQRLHSAPTWDTEFHYTNFPGVGDAGDAVFATEALFDHLDAGVSGIVWWSYLGRASSPGKASLQQAMVETLAVATPVPTTDGDGKVIGQGRGWFSTRAVRQGNDLVLWVVNDTKWSYPFKGIQVTMPGGGRYTPDLSAIELRQWKNRAVTPSFSEVPSGEVAALVRVSSRGVPQVKLPRRSISVVRFKGVF